MELCTVIGNYFVWCTKQEMINFIKNYDQSDNVNIFYIKNIPIWLDAKTRSK